MPDGALRARWIAALGTGAFIGYCAGRFLIPRPAGSLFSKRKPASSLAAPTDPPRKADPRRLMLTLFDEVAEDRRATDEKGLLVLGGYIAIIAIAATALGEDLVRQKAINVIASVSLALVGLLVVGLERSFRAWRTHYIGVSKELWSELGGMDLPEEVLPRWLTSPRRSHAWGAGNMLIWGTFIPVIGTVIYLIFALWPRLTNPGRWAWLGAGGLLYLGTLWLIYRKAGGPARS